MKYIRPTICNFSTRWRPCDGLLDSPLLVPHLLHDHGPLAPIHIVHLRVGWPAVQVHRPIPTRPALAADHLARESERLFHIVRCLPLVLQTVGVDHPTLGNDGVIGQENRHAAVVHGHGGEH